jgi:hypothetical protein
MTGAPRGLARRPRDVTELRGGLSLLTGEIGCRETRLVHAPVGRGPKARRARHSRGGAMRGVARIDAEMVHAVADGRE